MSKPLFRLAVAALIGLIIVVGVFATVQAAPMGSGQLKGRVDATAADPFYASQQRGGFQKISPYQAEGNGDGHGCESERVDPNDF
jgi:hypothetical protein